MEQVSNRQMFASVITNPQSQDADRARVLTHLTMVFGGVAGLGCVLIIVLAVIGIMPQQVIGAAFGIIGMAAVIVGGTLGALRASRHTAASNIFLYGSLIYVIGVIYLAGGVTGPASIAFLFPIVVAGLFGRATESPRLFSVALVSYITLAFAETAGILQPQNNLPGLPRTVAFVIFFTSVGGLLTYVASLWSTSTLRFLEQTRVQSEELYETNQRLIEKNIQQVELGSELSAAAGELLRASHEQASGASEQASAVSQVSTTIEELGSTARQIAIAAEQVAEAARQTLENLSEGQEAVDKSIQAMDRIRSRVQDVSARVLNLGERSQQIGEIIDLINDLSDETHLLALNAAIEAAGAGEHGRRFAVVAAEVKSLANRALVAAKEVKGVIAEIQQATNAAVLAAEEGGKEVAAGVELAHSAGQVMDAIVMVAERTAQSSAEINLATAQQQSASEQVVETMREIADVARRTAAGARQVQDAAQRLTAIANRLHGLSQDDNARVR
ncbi:methyl-accepting chemotaxis protein [Roseiflexus sp.]|uniref:methyl-accepting chemotaxis protein n=1 Tax=Roseiflexus sp. TaxID=2562120 RepID=UPI00398AA154